jgi:hypothetical protein|tara:strand:+ start:852 stop:1064 length:213 start_codon:yes stop_codon:yes gene_type:complete
LGKTRPPRFPRSDFSKIKPTVETLIADGKYTSGSVLVLHRGEAGDQPFETVIQEEILMPLKPLFYKAVRK